MDNESLKTLKEDIADALEAWEDAKKDTQKAIEWEEKIRVKILELNAELKKNDTTFK